MELLAVKDDCQSGVQEHIVLQQALDVLVLVLVILEYLFVRNKISQRAVRLFRRADRSVFRHDRFAVFHPLAFAVAVAGDQEIAA